MLRDSMGSTIEAEIIKSSSFKELAITVIWALLYKFFSEGIILFDLSASSGIIAAAPLNRLSGGFKDES